MKAVICAAGQGKRLMPYTRHTPKCLLKVGKKRILEYMLDGISKCGIGEVVIVIGYEGAKFKKIIGTKFKKCRIKYIINRDYGRTDNMYSLWLAKDEVNEGFVFFNADVIFNAKILKKLLDDPNQNAMVVDDKVKLEKSAMKVKITDNRLVEIGRSLKGGNARAVGMYKFSPEGAKIYFKEIKKAVYAGNLSYKIEKPIEQFLGHCRLYAVKTGNLAWHEIDDAEDLKKAVKKLKLILKNDDFKL